MKLTFLGANHEVTGSCTLLEAAGQRYLIDCGMEQGKDTYENQPIPVAPGEIDGVLATHATSTTPACCRCWPATGSGAGSMPPTPPWSCAASCCGTLPTSRSLRRSGKPQG